MESTAPSASTSRIACSKTPADADSESSTGPFRETDATHRQRSAQQRTRGAASRGVEIKDKARII